ncbi:hypothetical protein ACJMK2_038163, partial [Sinanodonta woodiana]
MMVSANGSHQQWMCVYHIPRENSTETTEHRDETHITNLRIASIDKHAHKLRLKSCKPYNAGDGDKG